MSDSLPCAPQHPAPVSSPSDTAPAAAKPRRARNRRTAAPAAPQNPPGFLHPLLEQLAHTYPALFGRELRPLKRGIFHDLLAALGPQADAEALKQALALHTRSTRYLSAVASGAPRHDLAGAAVEALAPEHIVHALREVFRRRQQRAPEDLTPRLRQRLLQALQDSGLSPQDWAECVRVRDEAANALIDSVVQEATARAAKDEALQRAFEASGQEVHAFAAMYGMDARAVAQALARALQRVPPSAA